VGKIKSCVRVIILVVESRIMTNLMKYLSLILVTLMLSSCFPDNVKENANQKFGDQHFKTAISLIELHKVRNGEYPKKLSQLEYIGDWDQMIFRSVEYERTGEGYELNLINGWMGKPENLNYPDDFWEGLGLVKSNMKQ